jgi:hypothetical protein
MVGLDPDRTVVLQAASTQPDGRMIHAIIIEMLKIVHASESDICLASPEPVFGWNFYIIHIDRSVVQTLAQLPESDIWKVKGDSINQKFVNWLNEQTKKNNIDDLIRFSLLSDLKSSRYGLF